MTQWIREKRKDSEEYEEQISHWVHQLQSEKKANESDFQPFLNVLRIAPARSSNIFEGFPHIRSTWWSFSRDRTPQKVLPKQRERKVNVEGSRWSFTCTFPLICSMRWSSEEHPHQIKRNVPLQWIDRLGNVLNRSKFSYVFLLSFSQENEERQVKQLSETSSDWRLNRYLSHCRIRNIHWSNK